MVVVEDRSSLAAVVDEDRREGCSMGGDLRTQQMLKLFHFLLFLRSLLIPSIGSMVVTVTA